MAIFVIEKIHGLFLKYLNLAQYKCKLRFVTCAKISLKQVIHLSFFEMNDLIT